MAELGSIAKPYSILDDYRWISIMFLNILILVRHLALNDSKLVSTKTWSEACSFQDAHHISQTNHDAGSARLNLRLDLCSGFSVPCPCFLSACAFTRVFHQ